MNKLSKQNKKRNYFKQKGFSLVEVLIACAIISISIFALMSASAKGIQLSNQAVKQTQANLLLEEGTEAVKSIRDTDISASNKGWAVISALTLNTTYYLSFSNSTNTWSLTTTAPQAIDSIFTRTVVFSSVNRDSNDDITSSGGTLDAGTLKVTITVSWSAQDGTTNSKTLSFYISNIF